MRSEIGKKLINISLIGILILSMFIFLLPVSAFSTETTSIGQYGFDNNQQTYAKVNGFNIFAFSSKLLFYLDDGTLSKTYTLTPFSQAQYNNINHYRCAIISMGDDTRLLVAYIAGDSYSGGTPVADTIFYATGYLDVNTLAWTTIQGQTMFTLASSTGFLGGQGMVGNALVWIKNTNSSGNFFYIWYGGEIKRNNTPTYSYGYNFDYVGKLVQTQWTTAYANKGTLTGTTTSWIFPNAFVIDTGRYSNIAPSNTAFVMCSNNILDGNRAYIYKLNFVAPESISYIGMSDYDYSYTGFCQTPNSAQNDGMLYVFGVGAYNSLINIEMAFSTQTGTGITFCSMLFNTSYVHAVSQDTGLTSTSLVVRPFTGYSQAPNGNSSGTYSIGYFSSIFGYTGSYTGGYSLTGLTLTLTGIETNTPSWQSTSFGYLFTPQEPQTNPYDTQEISGFQPLGATIGIFYDTIGSGGRAKANPMFNLAPSYSYNGMISGGIFNHAVIATAPTQITLQQNMLYGYIGNIYLNYVLAGNGSWSALSSSYSGSMTIFQTYTFENKIDGTITDGQFTFNLAPVNPTQTVYQVVKVNWTLTDGQTASYIYNFGFYAIGGQDSNGNIPYPSGSGSNGGGGVTGGTGGNGGAFSPTMTVSSIFWAGLMLTLVLALLFASIAGADGLLAGLIVGIALSCAFGLLPLYLIIVDIVIGALLVLSKSGYIGGR